MIHVFFSNTIFWVPILQLRVKFAKTVFPLILSHATYYVLIHPGTEFQQILQKSQGLNHYSYPRTWEFSLRRPGQHLYNLYYMVILVFQRAHRSILYKHATHLVGFSNFRNYNIICRFCGIFKFLDLHGFWTMYKILYLFYNMLYKFDVAKHGKQLLSLPVHIVV